MAPATVSTDRILYDISATDLAIYQAIAATPTPKLDRALRDLSKSANHSVLWLAISAALFSKPGHPRRAALNGVTSIAVASATVNIVAKALVRRSRPDPQAAAVPAGRYLRMPTSTSFPSGHAASALAFASAAGSELPWLSLPLHLLALSVAYSRVHTGVHYPGDVLVGAAIGSTCGEITGYTTRRLTASRNAKRSWREGVSRADPLDAGRDVSPAGD